LPAVEDWRGGHGGAWSLDRRRRDGHTREDATVHRGAVSFPPGRVVPIG
jgi:hypothetical protein